VHARLAVVGVVLGGLAVLPTMKLIGVQASDASDLVRRGELQRSRTVVIDAPRGSILDRNGVEMAISVPASRVVANMSVLRAEGLELPVDLRSFAGRLAPALGVDPSALADTLVAAAPDDTWVRLAEAIEPEQAREAVELAEAEGIEGALTIEPSTRRVHTAGASGARILGTLGPDGPSELAGIEAAYDEELTGDEGEKVVERGTGGSTIAGSERVVAEPAPGSDVQLTLDRTLQHQVEQVLADAAARTSSVRAIAIVGLPATGEILAAGAVERGEDGRIRLADGPIAFSNAYQAGSVFKLVSIAAAVDHGVVAPDTTLEVPDRIEVDDRTFTDHERHPTEVMTVSEVLARSSNVGTIKIAQELGAPRLHDALVRFGFGRRTGVGHPAESAGILPPVEAWTRPDLAASSIGTHQSASAVQLWAAYNVIANQGRYVAPRLVDAVVDHRGRRREVTAPEPVRVISGETARRMTDMLEAVVRDGTGRLSDLPGYSVAAKTGTSRLAAPDRVDATDAYRWADGRFHHLAAFSGFLPAERPQVSITVLLEDIAPGLTGGTAAAPVFSELAKLSIRELGIVPSGGRETRPSGERVRAEPAATPATATDDGGAGRR
jgi:cell division protein FtsI (penicillin-binding protein 3)